jgi:hypothetical protein
MACHSVKVVYDQFKKKGNIPDSLALEAHYQGCSGVRRADSRLTEKFPSRFGRISLQSGFPFFQNSPP